MQVDNANSKEIMRQLQYLTMVLMSMYGHREIVTKASMQVLHDLVNIIILILLEPSVPDLPEGAQLVRYKIKHHYVVIFIGIIGLDLPMIFALLPKSGKLLMPSMYSSLPSGITFSGYGNKCPTVAIFCWHMY